MSDSDSTVPKSILLLAANPKGKKSLRLQEEERDIKERLRLAGYGKLPINSIGATRPRDIQRAMLDFKPQIVHFSGHGAGQEGLVFEDVTGEDKLVSSDALADLFKLFSSRVECVVLCACFSKFQAEAISQHIDFVVGMSRAIDDCAAIEFSVGFYGALGAGESIEFAYDMGCNAIQLAGIEESLTPVLFRKNKSSSSAEKNIIYDKKRTRFKIVIEQEVDEAQLGEIAGPITELLQRITGDSTLKIKRVDAGSIRLVIESSPQAFEILQELHRSGQLSILIDMPVSSVELEKDFSEEKIIQNRVISQGQSSVISEISDELEAELTEGNRAQLTSSTNRSNYFQRRICSLCKFGRCESNTREL